MGAGVNGSDQWEWEENVNKTRLNLGLGMWIWISLYIVNHKKRDTLYIIFDYNYGISWPIFTFLQQMKQE